MLAVRLHPQAEPGQRRPAPGVPPTIEPAPDVLPEAGTEG